MDPAKIEFLFSEVPHGFDPDDPDERMSLLTAEYGADEDEPLVRGQLGLRAVVADQIATDNPPNVWRTAQRLLGEGHDRVDVMRQLVMALTPSLMNVVVEGSEFDLDAYLAALNRLPIPSVADVGSVMIEIVRTQQGITVDELEAQVTKQLDLPAGDLVTETLLNTVSDYAIGPDGPLEMLAPDRVLHVESLTDGVVLTHRIYVADLHRPPVIVGPDGQMIEQAANWGRLMSWHHLYSRCGSTKPTGTCCADWRWNAASRPTPW